MSRHRTSAQQVRQHFGVKAEEFVTKLFKAQPSGCDCFDLESKNFLIEVKSCNAANKTHRGSYVQFGRFVIDTHNHIGLYLESLKRGKTPVYVFVIRIGKRMVWQKVAWERLHVPNDKEHHMLPWTKIFVPEAYRGCDNGLLD